MLSGYSIHNYKAIMYVPLDSSVSRGSIPLFTPSPSRSFGLWDSGFNTERNVLECRRLRPVDPCSRRSVSTPLPLLRHPRSGNWSTIKSTGRHGLLCAEVYPRGVVSDPSFWSTQSRFDSVDSTRPPFVLEPFPRLLTGNFRTLQVTKSQPKHNFSPNNTLPVLFHSPRRPPTASVLQIRGPRPPESSPQTTVQLVLHV